MMEKRGVETSHDVYNCGVCGARLRLRGDTLACPTHGTVTAEGALLAEKQGSEVSAELPPVRSGYAVRR